MFANAIHSVPKSAMPQVHTTGGLVIGRTFSESHAFYSIPYGQPPIGMLRCSVI